MKSKLIAVISAALFLCPATGVFAQNQVPEGYLRAVELYEKGIFERAESIFSEISASTGDVMAKGYETLCSLRLLERGCEKLASDYVTEYPYSKLVPQIHFYSALNYFDKEEYRMAANEFAKIPDKSLHGNQLAEYSFKRAYSLFEEGWLEDAKDFFLVSEQLPYSDYTAPSRYSLGYVNYTQKNFREALDWFERAGKDPRFTEISNYYGMECRFMLKDYNYVVKNGTKIYSSVPEERKPHLARIISESYLALGDNEKAKEYYDKIQKKTEDMDRDDYFYSGTVLYSVEDYKGAIDNFSKMTARNDSIGQIANYQMGYSLVQTGNKVAALDAFKDASVQPFNPDIREDAHFNYAKLSFDLNHNPSVFEDYLKKYPDNKKGDMIYSYIALASLYNHDYAGAVEAYSNIDMLDQNQKSNYMRANYLRANQLIRNGSYKDAIPLLKAAAYYSDKRETFNQLAKYWLGESYYRSDRFDDAVETFTDLYNNSALEGKKEGRLIPYNLAYSYFRQGDYDSAAKWFEEYLQERNPLEGEDAASRLADCDFIRKDYTEAVSKYEKAIRRFEYSDNLYPFYKAGIAYGLQGRKEKKIDMLSNVLDADPSAAYYSETMYELGRAYVSAGDDASAQSTFLKLRSNTDDKSIAARSLIELGMIARNNSESQKALGYYKQVISEMPGTEYARDALSAIESIYQSEGRMDEYFDYADKVGAIKGKTDSEKEQMYFNAAEQLYLSENWSKALPSLQNYLQRYPEGRSSAKAAFYIAECNRNLGNREQACEWYRKAIAEGGSFVETALLNYSDLSYGMERYKDAFNGYSDLGDVASSDSGRHAARLGMMRAAYKDGDFPAAISNADKATSDAGCTAAEKREADYVKAKSYLSMNDRDEAFALFGGLSAYPSTPEGAEATYMIIQDAYDKGEYGAVEKKVFAFSENAGGQDYWLAKAFITLGDSYAEQENYKQAKATFESILNGYSPAEGTADDILDNVRMRLAKLTNLM